MKTLSPHQLFATLLVAVSSVAPVSAPAFDDGLKPGVILLGEERRFVPDFTTREEVEALYGPALEEVDVKQAKALGYLPTWESPPLKRCFPADADKRVHFWKYGVATLVPGKQGADEFGFSPVSFAKPKQDEDYGYIYIAYHPDGRLCVAKRLLKDF